MAKDRSKFRRPQHRAGLCPRNSEHVDTVVYRTKGSVRYCKCNDCGETWKQSGDDPIVGYLTGLAKSLEDAPRVGEEKAVLIPDEDAKAISQTLLSLVTTP